MSVDFTAATQRCTGTGFSFSTANFTLMAWVQRDADTGAYAVPVSIRDNATAYALIGTEAGGDILYAEHNLVGTEDVDVAGPTLNNTDWFFVCFARAGTGANATKFHYAANAAVLTTGQFTTTATFTCTQLVVGDLKTTGETWNGKVANVKFWSAGLTQAEVEIERWQYQPRRTADLQAWYPLFEGGGSTDNLSDYSGNGHTMTGGASSTTGANPPIIWAPPQRYYFIPATAPAQSPVPVFMASYRQRRL